MPARKSAVLDTFIPHPDAGGRYEITIHAPADLVLNVARNFDIESVRMVRGIFWLRAKVLGAALPAERPRQGLVDNMKAMGWVCLADQPGRFYIGGAACQPWLADVVFSPIVPEQFVDYTGPDQVKIAWTLEVESLGPALTRFATETRVVATDDQARVRFRSYWRKFGIGIVLIRRLLLPVIRRHAEQQYHALLNACA